MTQVDFYLLSRQENKAWLLFVCYLTEKIYSLGYKIAIHSPKQWQLQQLDNLLWQYKDVSFLPHRITNQCDSIEPIRLYAQEIKPIKATDVLITLNPIVQPFFADFQRIVEPISANPEMKQYGRQRFCHYRDQGYVINTHHC